MAGRLLNSVSAEGRRAVLHKLCLGMETAAMVHRKLPRLQMSPAAVLTITKGQRSACRPTLHSRQTVLNLKATGHFVM